MDHDVIKNLRWGHHALPMEVEIAARRPRRPAVLEIKNLDGLRLDIHAYLEEVHPLLDPHYTFIPVEVLEGANGLGLCPRALQERLCFSDDTGRIVIPVDEIE